MKEFIKNKYNILIPIFLLIVLFIAVLLYTKEYKNNRYAYTDDVEVYQYFSNIKMEYTARISRNKKNVVLDFVNNDFDVSLDSTPVYLKNNNSVIFPKEMSIVFPLTDMQYRVSALSEVYMKNDLYYLNVRNLNKTFDHLFFFDGNNLYFFVDNVKLTVGDKVIELSPMSYVSASYLNFVEYYDKETDTFETIDINNEKVVVENEYMTIDVTSDKVIFKDSFSLLTKDFSTLGKVTDINS